MENTDLVVSSDSATILRLLLHLSLCQSHQVACLDIRNITVAFDLIEVGLVDRGYLF